MFVEEDPENSKGLICELTGARLSKSRKAVMQHVNGQAYKLALQQHNHRHYLQQQIGTD